MASWERLVEHGRELGPDPELADVGTAQLTEQVRTQAARIAADTARWVVLVAELVVRGVWADEGARTPGAWLSWAVGMAPTTAREHVRVGLALRTLPSVRARFLAGTISYSKVRALTRLGHEETEGVLLAWADAAPAAELERIVSATRRCAIEAGIEADPFADVDATDGSCEAARIERVEEVHLEAGASEVRLRMDEADAARLLTSLRWLARQEDAELPFSARLLAALDGAVAAAMDRAPADTSGLDRDRLVVEARVVEDGPAELGGGQAETDSAESVSGSDGGEGRRQLRLLPRPGGAAGRQPAMSASTLRRLACTASIVPVVVDGTGQPLDVGREQRLATAKQRRALRLRDPSCRFPGCHASRHLHAHHAVEWDDGGRTDLDNLVHLCGFHHRFVHRNHWAVEPLGAGRFRFLDPAGTPVAERPPPMVAASMPGGSDSAESLRPRDPTVAGPDRGALEPAWWDGLAVDHGLCVEVLLAELQRRQRTALPDGADLTTLQAA